MVANLSIGAITVTDGKNKSIIRTTIRWMSVDLQCSRKLNVKKLIVHTIILRKKDEHLYQILWSYFLVIEALPPVKHKSTSSIILMSCLMINQLFWDPCFFIMAITRTMLGSFSKRFMDVDRRVYLLLILWSYFATNTQFSKVLIIIFSKKLWLKNY